jgi:hypothetical protein
MNWRSKKLLEACRELPCGLCGVEDGTVVAAHSNQQKDGKGTGIKAHDFRVAALCYRCHMQIDQGGAGKEEKRQAWEEAHRKTIGWLFQKGILDVISK